MSYRLEIKSSPEPAGDGAGQRNPQPGLTDERDTPPRWSGDLYVEGDEPDPSTARAQLAGADGEEAWLMSADDGTLTGWVRDSDGTVYRYTDPEAWAIDVDGAQMKRTGGEAAAPADEAADGPADDAPDDTGNPVDDVSGVYSDFLKKGGQKKSFELIVKGA